MQYTITSDALGLAIGPMAETANDVQEALNRARQMSETGLANVSIEDEAGHKIDGDELLDCITGKKKITEDLRAVRRMTWKHVLTLQSFSNHVPS
jgi:2-methylisocitrate lyase-like PEP mutase family enzyme